MQGDEAPVKVGEILAQKYRVDRVLGVGGMGVVVAATHLQLDQKVALKFMLREAFANQDALARFQREARAVVKLKSEHVARVSDTGTFDNGSPYIVMEFLDGSDLAGELERHGSLSIADVAEYVIQACDALAEAHALGIVHRDLKPANLFLARRADGSPIVKVLDFGISKASPLSEGGAELTKTASMMGSPLYMSPEQIRSSKDVDARTDVWSLGVIMYQLLAGAVPFNSDTMGGLLSQIMIDSPRPLQQVRADLPEQVYALVTRCLEKALEARCQHVAEIAIALAPFCPPRTLPLVDRISTVSGVRAAVSLPKASAPSPMSQSAVVSAPVIAAGGQTADPWASTGRDPRTQEKPRALSRIVWIAPITVTFVGLMGAAAFAAYSYRQGHNTALGSDVGDSSPPFASAQTTGSAVALPIQSAQPSKTDGDAGALTVAVDKPAPGDHPASPPITTRLPPKSTTPAGPASNSVAPTKPAPPKPAAANCTTPFTLDPDGRKIPRPECL